MEKHDLDSKFAFLFKDPKPTAVVYAVSGDDAPKLFNVASKFQVDFVELFESSIEELFVKKAAYTVEDFSTATNRQFMER